MKKPFIQILSIFLFGLSVAVRGQNILFPGVPKIMHLPLEDYGITPQIWGFIQDSRGYLYIASTSGLIIFDGQNYRVLKPPFISVIKAMAKDEKNRIYIGAYNRLLYVSSDSIGDFYLKNIDSAEKYNLGYVYKIIYNSGKLLIKSDSGINIYDLKQKKLSLLTKKSDYRIDKVYDDVFLYHRNKIYKVDFFNKKIINSKLSNVIFPSESVLGIFPAFRNKILVIKRNSILLLDKNYKILINRQLSHNLRLASYTANNNYAFINFKEKGLWIYDRNLNLVNIFNRNSGLSVNTFYAIYNDNYNNLWLGGDNGVDYFIINSPNSFLDKRFGFDLYKEMTYFNNKFYFIFNKTIGYLPDTIMFNPHITQKTPIIIEKIKILGQNWHLCKLNNSLLISHNPGIIQVTKQNNIKYIDSIKSNVWRIKKIPNTNNIFIGSNEGGFIAEYDKTNNFLYNFKKVVNGEIKNFIIDKDKNFWGIIISDSAYFVKAQIKDGQFKVIKYFSEKDGIEPLFYSTIFYDKNENKIIVNEYTIKYYDSLLNKFVEFKDITKHFKNKNEHVYLLYIDDLGNYWVNCVNDSLPVNYRFKAYLFKKEKKHLKFLPLLTQSVNFGDYYFTGYTYNKRFVFLKTIKGMHIFDYQYKIDSSKYHFNIYFRKIVSTNDNKIIWAGNTPNKDENLTSLPPKLKLKYKKNSIEFYIAAPFYENYDDILFSYRLEGINDKRSQWTTVNKKDYTFLREGKYTLHVRAKNIYDVYAPELTYTFWVRPPWYRSFWAYIFYLLLIMFILRLYGRKLKERNRRLEGIVSQRTTVIEDQKQELKRQAESLEKANKRLQERSIIAEKTNNAIILTDKNGNFIWANSAYTEIFGYTLNELITQVSPNIIGEQTPSYIRDLFSIAKTKKITVEYDAEFKTKYGKSIWVHTTITPILNKDNEIEKFIIIDSDVTQLKIAGEKIKGSIRYSKIIQENILPNKDEIDIFFDSFIIYLPRDIVSGDFYWISKLFSDKNQQYSCISEFPFFKVGEYIFFSVIDCTGHGVPGAFMSIIGNRLLDNFINKSMIHDPAQVFYYMDQELAQIFKNNEIKYREGMAGCLCRFDKICKDNKTTIKLTVSNAKGNVLLFKKNKNELIRIKGIRRYLNQYMPETIDFNNQIFYLDQGDIVFLFSDGIVDQNNVERKKFGNKRLQRIILENVHLSMNEIKQKLEENLKEWMSDTEQRDDITVIGLKIKI